VSRRHLRLGTRGEGRGENKVKSEKGEVKMAGVNRENANRR
jgi:hypothetical protein